MARKTQQKRKAKIKDTPISIGQSSTNDDDELMDDSVPSNDEESILVQVEYEENTAETSDYSNKKATFSCAVSDSKQNLLVSLDLQLKM